jgi:hypothetical protein
VLRIFRGVGGEGLRLFVAVWKRRVRINMAFAAAAAAAAGDKLWEYREVWIGDWVG